MLTAFGAGNIGWESLFNLLTTSGDLWILSGGVLSRLAAGAVGTYLQGKGAGVDPAYESTMPPLTTKGDLVVQGLTIPERIVAPPWGNVLVSNGVGNIPYWTGLFNLLTTQGDIWVRGAADPQRLAAGALDAYLKSQGAGVLPIYEKMKLNDTGIHIDNFARSTAGDLVITGVGFQPSVVFFLCADGTISNMNASIGFDNLSDHMCLTIRSNHTQIGTNVNDSIQVYRSGANALAGEISAMGADGFTITFSLWGTCDLTGLYLALP